MKYFNKFVKTTPLLLLPLMGSAMATDITVPLNFTTLPVIDIQELTPMAFGDVLSLAQASTCVMSATAGDNIALADEGQDMVTLNGANATPGGGDLSSACAGLADGQPGVYEITSFAGANITVSVTAGVATEIALNPSGYVTSITGVSGATSTKETLAVGLGNEANVTASTTLTAFSAAGTNRVIVAGTITNQTTLTAGSPYATDFNLNVVYQ
jgi:hypothetical protein